MTTTAGQASTGIDAQLVEAARIAGTVMKPNGRPLLGIKVAAQKQSGNSWKTAGTATSNAKGKYVVGSLPAGTYRIKFIDTTGVDVDEFFNDQLMPDKAQAIKLDVGALHKAVAAKLAIAGRIGGVVRGRATSRCRTCRRPRSVREALAGSGQAPLSPAPRAPTGSVGLPRVRHRVRFSDPSGSTLTAYYQSAEVDG